jgi:endonuclease/exonuclease/phosphatase family metal-dependent hydrolase
MMTAAPAAGRAGAAAFRIGAAALRNLVLCLVVAGSPATRAELHGPIVFDLLSYNVRNLPDTGFETRRAAIEGMLSEFDLVVLQEDFEPDPLRDAWPHRDRVASGPEAAYRWYHLLAPLAWAAGHPVPYDSGLSLLAADGPAIAGIRTISRLPFADCHGVFGASLDCWATKGLLGVRVGFANGASVDVYTTHLDAGGHPRSTQARWNQMDALAREIGRISNGRPLILAGDFNAPDRRPDDRKALAAALAALNLTSAEAHARNAASRDCQVVQIYYRGTPATALEVLGAGEVPVDLPAPYQSGMNFCSSDRRRLGPSDHPALAARIRVLPISAPAPPPLPGGG